MLMLSHFHFGATMFRWSLNLATWLVARSLNMPDPVVHDTGVFVFAHVRTIENRIGKALCPMRLLRQLRSLLQR
jgi:hypothetical protein